MRSRRWFQSTVLYLVTVVVAHAQVQLNEVCAKNSTMPSPGGTYPDYVELFNTASTNVALTGWSLTDDLAAPTKFSFTVGTTIPGKGRLVVWLDSATNYAGIVATNFSLRSSGEQVALFQGSNRQDFVSFGPQASDLVLCRVPDGTGNWTAGQPSAGSTNVAATLGSPVALRINELLATNSAGTDWLELYNPPTNPPVSLGGLVLADTNGPATVPGIAPNTFIASGGFTRFWCTGNTNKPDYLAIKLSSTLGDTVSLYASDRSTLFDRVTFGPQTLDVSYGRLPDGGTRFFVFTPTNRVTPGASNSWLPLTNIVVNEILTHTDPPLEDAVELFNLSDKPVDISYWWLSNSQDQPLKFQIPSGTVVGPNGFVVFFEQVGSAVPGFNRSGTGNYPDFTFNSAHGDNVVLTTGDASGVTGYQSSRTVPASANGVAFTRYVKSDGGTDLVPESRRTFGHDAPSSLADFRLSAGVTNAYPLVGPLVIREIMYHPPDLVAGGVTNDNVADEYIALTSITNQPLPLFDPAYPTNTWHVDGGVGYVFPTNVTVQPGQTIVLVSFSPQTDAVQIAAFRSKYGVSNDVPVFGPYSGILNNSSDTIYLLKPDPVQQAPHPDAGYVPSILVEKVHYANTNGWPVAADGRGLSLHRLSLTSYANDSVNWFAALPQPGVTGIPNPAPVVVGQPQDYFVTADTTVTLNVVASGAALLEYQWRFKGDKLPGATASSLVMASIQTNQDGAYDVVITNLYGSATSRVAVVSVAGPPQLTTLAVAGSGLTDIGVSGRQGHIYELDASTDLVQWIPIATRTNASDYAVFSDPAATNYAQRFYRVILTR